MCGGIVTSVLLLVRWGDGWVVIGVEVLLSVLEKILLLLLWTGDTLLLVMWEIECCRHWIGISCCSITQHVLLLQFLQAIGAALLWKIHSPWGISLERVPLVATHF